MVLLFKTRQETFASAQPTINKAAGATLHAAVLLPCAFVGHSGTTVRTIHDADVNSAQAIRKNK